MLWKSELLHILQKVRANCKTRNQLILSICVRLAPRPHVFRHSARCWPSQGVQRYTTARSHTKHLRVWRVRATLVYSSGGNTAGGFYLMGSARGKVHGSVPPLRAPLPILSTRYEPLSQPLISILRPVGGGEGHGEARSAVDQ